MQKIDSNLIANIPYMGSREKQNSTSSVYELQIMLQTMLNFLHRELPLSQTAKSVDSLTNLYSDISNVLDSLKDIHSSIMTDNEGVLGKISDRLSTSVSDSSKSTSESAKLIANSVESLKSKIDGIKTVKLDIADITELKPLKITDIKVNNLSELTTKLSSIIECLESIEKTMETPDEKSEFVWPKEVLESLKKLNLLSTDADSPLSVRLSNGSEFVEAFKQAAGETVRILSGGGGFSALKDQDGTMYVAPKVGSGANNTFATVGVASSLILAASTNRVSVTLVNDSANTMYVAKGATAVVGSGIRLNANGGALIIDDFKGAIHAIAGGAGSNMTICEVTFV